MKSSRELAEEEWIQGLTALRDLERLGFLARIEETARVVHTLQGVVRLSEKLLPNEAVVAWLHSILEQIGDSYKGRDLIVGAAPVIPAITAAINTLLERADLEPLPPRSPLKEPRLTRRVPPKMPPAASPEPAPLPAAPRVRRLERAAAPIVSRKASEQEEDTPTSHAVLADLDVDAQVAWQELDGDPSNRRALNIFHGLKGGLLTAGLVRAGNAVHSIEEGLAVRIKRGASLSDPPIRELCLEAAARITRITQAALDEQMEEYYVLCNELRVDAETMLGKPADASPAGKAAKPSEEPAETSRDQRAAGIQSNAIGDLVPDVWALTAKLLRLSALVDARSAEEDEIDNQISRLRAIHGALNAKDRQGALFGGEGGELAGADGRRPGYALLDLTRSTPLNQLLVQMSEIIDSLTAQRRSQTEKNREIARSGDASRTTLTRLRERIMGLRLERFDVLARHCQGAAADMARRERKEVRLVFEGGDVLLDRNTAAKIRPALQQLVRNAVAHGVECPRPAGKNSVGEISVRASPGEPGIIVISVGDDGAGLNFEAIEQRADQLGKPRPPSGVWTTADLLNVLFEPGFSTRPDADAGAGRGQGMDVIARIVESAGGHMKVVSKEGRGTTFRIELPTQLDYAEMMVLESGGLPYAIRRAGVRNFDLRMPADFWTPEASALLPCQRPDTGALMHAILLPRALGHPENPPAEGWPVIELDTSAGPLFLAVDRVMQSMPGHIRLLDPILRVPPWTGITTHRDGRGALVIDPASVWEAVQKGTLPPAPVEPPAALRRRRALVADDSSSVRRALCDTLAGAGWEAEACVNGEAAWDAFQRAPQAYAAVLTDLEMPHANGYELLGRIRAVNPEVPVIVITSRASAAHQEEARRLGATSYLTKPIDADELHAQLARWCPVAYPNP